MVFSSQPRPTFAQPTLLASNGQADGGVMNSPPSMTEIGRPKSEGLLKVKC